MCGKWMDIKTAPRDGTRILGYGDCYYGVSITSWCDIWREWVCEAETADDGHGWSGHDTFKPTHWMPLPKPPETEQ